MKRVVFLLLVVALCSFHSVAASTTETYLFTDYEIRLTYGRNEENRLGYVLQKVGLSPFAIDLYYPDSDLHVNNVIEVDGNHVVYGYIHQDGTESYYSGFFTVLSPTGEELEFTVIDDGFDEDVRHIFPMDNVLMMVVLHVEDLGDGHYVFLEYEVQIYNHEYNLLNTLMVPVEDASFIASESMLLVDTDNDGDYEQGILEDGTRITDTDGLHIEQDTTFNGSVYIPFLNSAIINNQSYSNGIIIDYPGNYTMVYLQTTYHFVVDTTISGVVDGMVYHDSVTPIITAGQVFLNNDLFVSGTIIDKPGDYNLSVRGVNGYEQTVHFTITSNMEGVLDHQTYYDNVEIVFNGTGYLNNTFITSPYIVEEPGTYVLTIEGENNYVETYEFEIDDTENELTFIRFLQQYDLIILGITVVSGFLILKKK